jgi:hypothetical protein
MQAFITRGAGNKIIKHFWQSALSPPLCVINGIYLPGQGAIPDSEMKIYRLKNHRTNIIIGYIDQEKV